MPLYCGGLDSIPELSKSWYATPAHRYRNCQCALISNGYRISAECRNTPSCPALFQHLGRNITLPQIIQSRVNPYRFTIENGHDAPYRGIRDDVDISKDYVDIDAEPFSNLRHQRFRNFLGHILHPDQSLAFRQSHQRGSHGSLFISGDNAYQISNQRKDARSLHPDNNFAVSPKVSMTWSTGASERASA